MSRFESADDRRVRLVALTAKGKQLIVPIFRKHAAAIRRVFAEVSPEERQRLEKSLKQVGRRAEALGLKEERKR